MLKTKVIPFRTNKIMASKIKIKHIIIFTLVLMLSIAMFSSFAIERSRDDTCYDIRREIGLCDFFVNNLSQKKVCLNNLKERFGTSVYNKCVSY